MTSIEENIEAQIADAHKKLDDAGVARKWIDGEAMTLAERIDIMRRERDMARKIIPQKRGTPARLVSNWMTMRGRA